MPPLAPDLRRPVLWSWRPEAFVAAGGDRDIGLQSGSRIAPGISLFHDATDATGALTAEGAGVEIGLDAFDGSYLSLAFDLPVEALPLLAGGRIFEAAAAIDCEPWRRAWVRLNLQRESGIARCVGDLAPGPGAARAALDIATFPHVVEPGHAWAEIIFDAAPRTKIALPDLVFWIAPRARI